MGDLFQQGTHSCSSPGSESCQNLGEYILFFLGLIISIIIGFNVMTLLRYYLEGSLNQLFHNFSQEDNTLELTPITPKKLLVHGLPARKQTHKLPVYQDPSVFTNPPICQNPPVHWKSPVSQNPAVSDLCILDTMTHDLIPPGSCRHHSVLSPEPNQCLDTRLLSGDDTVSQYWQHSNCSGTCQYDWNSPRSQAKELSASPSSSQIHFKKYLGKPAKRVKAKSKMGLEAYVFSNPPIT